jgi:outer membrane protein assembly factor BamB
MLALVWRFMTILLALPLLSGCREDDPVSNPGSQGRIAWRVDEVRSPYSQGWIGADAMSVYVYRSDHSISAIDLTTHAVRWTAEADPREFGGPGLRGVGRCGSAVVFSSYLAAYGVTPATGSRMWRWRPSAGGAFDFGHFACDGESIYVGTGSRSELYAVDAATGAERWRVSLASTTGAAGFVWSPSVSSGVVVACTREFGVPFRGKAVGLDARTGALRWTHTWSPLETGKNGGCGNPPATTADRALVPVDDGRVFVLDLASGALLATIPPVPGYLTPAEERPIGIAGDVAAIGSLSGIVTGVDVRSGQQLWTTQDAFPPVTTLIDAIIADGDLFVGVNTSGWALAFDVQTGARRWTLFRRGELNVQTLAPSGTFARDLVLFVATDGLYALRR